jgi:hypothetical protein
MIPAFAFVLSLLRFIAEEAPHLVTDIRTLVAAWASKKGIPHEDILPALDALDPRVAAVDAEVDQAINARWGKTPPGGTPKP